VPKSLADGEPVGDGRNEPNRNPHLPPPRDRLDWSLAFRQPFNFIRMLIGPDNYNCIKFCCCSIILITFCAFIALVIAQLIAVNRRPRYLLVDEWQDDIIHQGGQAAANESLPAGAIAMADVLQEDAGSGVGGGG